MFLRSAWCAAAFSSEVEPNPRARTILNEPIVLFRNKSWTVAALEDCCSHRLMPLSKGHVAGDAIVCWHNGLTFDNSGRCIHVPHQTVPPSGLNVRSCPAQGNCIYDDWTWTDIAPPPTFRSSGAIQGRAEGWVLATYRPPSFFVNPIEFAEAGTGGLASPRQQGRGKFRFSIYQCITPETQRTTHFLSCWHTTGLPKCGPDA